MLALKVKKLFLLKIYDFFLKNKKMHRKQLNNYKKIKKMMIFKIKQLLNKILK